MLGTTATDLQSWGLPPGSGGHRTSSGVMANIVYEYSGFGGYLQPYLGAGLGVLRTEWHGQSWSLPGGADLRADGARTSLAWQVFAGAAFPVAAVPGLAVTAEYRFLGATSPDLVIEARDGLASFDQIRIDVANLNHAIIVGLRYNFGQGAGSPAAPPAAAAPARARSFLVFFDWNRADLSERARLVIAEAALARASQPVTRIEVDGHADTSGAARTNQVLSLRRAVAVADELVRHGVPRAEITTRGFGSSRLLVPTAADVREPQNRRVEIILR